MKNISAPLKGMVLAISVATLSMAGSAQAHSNLDYSVPAQLLLFNALLQPHYDHGHDHRYKRKFRHKSHGHSSRQRYGHNSHGYKKGHGYYKPRKHSHSYGGYREKRLIKERYRY